MEKVIKRLKLLLFISIVIVPAFVMADPGDPGSGGEGDPTNPINDAELPFDGGVSLLVAAGVAYGLKKANDKRKAEKA